jgi:arylsulfatase A
MTRTNRRQFLKTSTACLAGASTAPLLSRAGNAESADRPPNLIVIMADDMGAKELSCYGNAEHNTPNLDRLGETGVRFETSFATPICHPTRAMIMTGQYGCHNGIYNFAGRRGGPDRDSPVEDLGANHITFAQILKPRGYATALAGKWQMSGKLPNMIHECGFDEYCVWAYKHYLPEGVKHTGGWENPGKPSRYWNPSILRNGEYTPTGSDDYGPDIYTEFLVDFIKRHKEQPFFLYYPMCLTHGPHLPTPDNVEPDSDRYKGKQENYKGTVEYTDKLVGRLVKALDDLGLRENTILFFTGDNGTGGSGKSDPTELGARVPTIVNGPGIVKPRGGTGELTDLSDILPTLAEFAGADVPKDRPIDGRSLAPFLSGEADTTRDWIFSYIADRRILRTQRWLLEDNSPLHWGRLYDCGDSRDGTGYEDVTGSDRPEVAAVERRFKELLADLPSPVLPKEGSTREKKR